jgi:WD repeat-containing protein 19
LEFKGDYEVALRMYEGAMSATEEDPHGGPRRLCTDAEYALCMAGYARCTLRRGNLRKGIAMVLEADDMQLCRDCAAILEGNKATLSEAAALYERAQLFEKAAAIYIQIKSFAQAARIMGQVTLPKLHSQYAKACEAEKKFSEAAEAYERAHDMDSVVRVCLEKLNDPAKAFSIVRRTASATGALMVRA